MYRIISVIYHKYTSIDNISYTKYCFGVCVCVFFLWLVVWCYAGCVGCACDLIPAEGSGTTTLMGLQCRAICVLGGGNAVAEVCVLCYYIFKGMLLCFENMNKPCCV